MFTLNRCEIGLLFTNLSLFVLDRSQNYQNNQETHLHQRYVDKIKSGQKVYLNSSLLGERFNRWLGITRMPKD